MYKSKLMQLLSAFEEGEWKAFQSYHRMHYSSEGDEYTLYLCIKSKRQNLQSPSLSLDNLLAKHFPSMSKKYLQNAMSRLTNRINEYFIDKELKQDDAERKLRLFMAYNKRGLYHRADLLAERLKNVWSDEKHCDHQRIYKLLQLNHFHYLSNNPIKYTNKNILLDLLKSYSMHRESLKMYYHAIFENAKFFKLVSADNVDFDKLLHSFSDLNSKTFYQVCKSLLAIQIDANNNDFKILYNLLTDKETHFSKEVEEVIYQNCEHFINKKMYEGNTSYVSNLFSLYEYGIDNDIVTANGKLPQFRFHRYIAAACAFEEVIWARMFKSKYIVLIPQESIDSSKLISAGQISFAEKKYLACIKTLQQYDVFDINEKLIIRRLLLCSHFILHDNYDFMYSVINNFVNFIYYNKSKMTLINYRGNLDLVKVLRMYISNENMISINEMIDASEYLVFRYRLPTIFAQRKLYEEKLAVAQNT